MANIITVPEDAVKYEIDIDIWKPIDRPTAFSMQYDQNTRYIIARIWNNGELYPITSENIITFGFTKTGNQPVLDECDIDSEGRIVYEMTPQSTSIDGRFETEFRIYDTDTIDGVTISKKKATPKFWLWVEKSSILDDAIISLPEVNILTNLINSVGDLTVDVNDAVDRANEAISTINTTNTNVQNAENIRITSENGRISAETTRVGNENTRLSNETSRVSAESGRVTAESSRVSAESTRSSNETSRQSNESTRQSQESTRQGFYNSYKVLEAYDNGKPYVVNNKVIYQGGTYQNILNSTGISPTYNTNNLNWICISAKGSDGTGGDMMKSVYDPNNKNTDAFNSANQTYNNSISGLTATNAKAAIDEVKSEIGDLNNLGTESNADLVSAVNDNSLKIENIFKGYLIFDVTHYGADKTGATDSTAVINLALTALNNAGGGILFFPHGIYMISSTINLTQFSNINIMVKGVGKKGSRIIRKSSFTSGDMFLVDSSGGLVWNSVIIEDIWIYHDTSINVTSGYGIHIKNSSSNPTSINRVWMDNGYGGIWLDNTSLTTLNEVFYNQEAPYSALYSSYAGLYVSGHSNTNFVSNCDFFGQNLNSPNNLNYGILIAGADGLQVINTAASGLRGCTFYGGYHAYNIDDVYFSNCLFDNCSTACIQTVENNAPYVFTNIRFSDCHINLGGSSSGQDCIQLMGDCDYIQFSDCNINLGKGAGIFIGAGNNYLGVSKKSINILNCDISENNTLNSSGISGIDIDNAASGISIINCTIQNRSNTGHQKYAISIGSGCADLNIQNNKVSNNETGTIYFNGTRPTNSMIKDNLGIDEQIGSVASASTISIPQNRIISLTGNTTITTINGGWSGREVKLFANDGTLSLGTGGNILIGKALNQFRPVTLTMVGSNWIIDG